MGEEEESQHQHAPGQSPLEVPNDEEWNRWSFDYWELY
jgi:hypothetical protein